MSVGYSRDVWVKYTRGGHTSGCRRDLASHAGIEVGIDGMVHDGIGIHD